MSCGNNIRLTKDNKLYWKKGSFFCYVEDLKISRWGWFCSGMRLLGGSLWIPFISVVHFHFKSTGAEWDRQQPRLRSDARKPVSLWVSRTNRVTSVQRAGAPMKITGFKSACFSSLQLQWVPEGRSHPSVHVGMPWLTAPQMGNKSTHTVPCWTHLYVWHICEIPYSRTAETAVFFWMDFYALRL